MPDCRFLSRKRKSGDTFIILQGKILPANNTAKLSFRSKGEIKAFKTKAERFYHHQIFIKRNAKRRFYKSTSRYIMSKKKISEYQ